LRLMNEEEWKQKVVDRIEDPRSTNEMFAEMEKFPLDPTLREFVNKLKRWKGTEKEESVRRILKGYIGEVDTQFPQTREQYAEMRWTRRMGREPHDPTWLIDGEGKEKGLDEDYSALAAQIPKFDDPRIRWPSSDDDDANAVGLKRLSLQTGWSKKEIRKFRVKNLVTHRVVNQTRMGKIASMYNLAIAGNGDGLLGVGEGKSAEPEDSWRQASMNAIRNMKPINRYEDRTIFGEVSGKVGAVEVKLNSRPPGFGIRCQHLIFEMCRCAGIHDLAARSTRSRNPMNTVKATFEALTSQKLPEDIARARGKKLVDVRKVYYAGKVQ